MSPTPSGIPNCRSARWTSLLASGTMRSLRIDHARESSVRHGRADRRSTRSQLGRTRLGEVVAASLLTLLVVACSSSGGSELNRAQWSDAANGLCRDATPGLESADDSETIEIGIELVEQLEALRTSDSEIRRTVESFRSAMATPATRGDYVAMEAIGASFDALGALDCGRMFKSG